MEKYKIDFHDEDEFLYAIKNSDEIEMDMRQRDNGNDDSNGDENYKETTNKQNENYEDYQQEQDDDNDNKENERNNTHEGNFENLGSDYISLF